jgi:hypothetical protein
MEAHIKHCIINAYTNTGWYKRGSDRLHNSLVHHGYSGDVIITNGFANHNYDMSCGYNVKAAALEEAINKGYTHILWLDCSVFCIKNPAPLFDVINHEGIYFWKSGYNCAQTCNDRILEYFGVDRNDAEKMGDCSTSQFGLNLNNPVAREFAERFLQACKDGMAIGSRFHDNQSSDPRFLFHRNEQSIASLLIGLMGLKMYDPAIYSIYYQPEMPESVIFPMQGL